VFAGGCTTNIRERPAPPAAIAHLRQYFLHDEIVQLLLQNHSRESLRNALLAKGFHFDGTQRQADQDSDGFSQGVALAQLPIPAIGMTIIYGHADRPIAINVLAIKPDVQERAKELLAFSVDPVAASKSGTLRFIGNERLAPNRLLKLMLRSERPMSPGGTLLYSIFYAIE
jgi:hypothetical protein